MLLGFRAAKDFGVYSVRLLREFQKNVEIPPVDDFLPLGDW